MKTRQTLWMSLVWNMRTPGKITFHSRTIVAQGHRIEIIETQEHSMVMFPKKTENQETAKKHRDLAGKKACVRSEIFGYRYQIPSDGTSHRNPTRFRIESIHFGEKASGWWLRMWLRNIDQVQTWPQEPQLSFHPSEMVQYLNVFEILYLSGSTFKA